MNSNSLLYGLVSIAVLAIAGLLLAQVFWFREALRLKEEQFQDKMFVVVNHIGQEIRDDLPLQDQLSNFLESERTEAQVSSEQELLNSLRGKIGAVFQQHDIQTPFHFGIFQTHNCDDQQVLLTDLASQDISRSSFQTSETLGCFMPGHFNHLSLGLNFPRKQLYLFRQTGGMIGLTLTLLLILLSAFAYTLYIVHRQKKLAVIKNDFLNNLTHELKTPLASIALASKVLQKNMPPQATTESSNYLHLISHESKRLENHIDKVLQVALIDSGNFSLDLKAVDMHEVIQRVVNSSELIIQEKKGSLDLKLEASNSVIQADAHHLFNMFYNLVDNAIKYSTKPPEILIATSDQAEGICFRIVDQGIGMDQEVQRNIFEKFYRASTGNEHKVKGFGLGLSYVKSIVEAHKGSIQFKSVLNQGTEFRILLPQI